MSLGHEVIALGEIVGMCVAEAEVLVKITTVRQIMRAFIY